MTTQQNKRVRSRDSRSGRSPLKAVSSKVISGNEDESPISSWPPQFGRPFDPASTVSPAMIHAGLAVWARHDDQGDLPKELVVGIFLAMLEASRQRNPQEPGIGGR